jgi:hypothetical protein
MDNETKASLIVTVVGVALIVGLIYSLYPNSFSAYSSDDSAVTTASTSPQDSNNIIHIPLSSPPDNNIGN